MKTRQDYYIPPFSKAGQARGIRKVEEHPKWTGYDAEGLPTFGKLRIVKGDEAEDEGTVKMFVWPVFTKKHKLGYGREVE